MTLNITSLQNPRVKLIRQLDKRKYRDQLGLFLIEGKREIERAIECGLKLHSYYFSDKNSSHLIISPATRVSAKIFAKISYRQNSIGHLAIFYQPSTSLDSLNLPKHPWLLVIESPEKPGNIGALLRTADAVQIDAVIITDPNTDLFNPNAVRAACGTFFSRPIYINNNDHTLELLQKNKIRIVATTPDTDRFYHQQKYPASIALIAGSEDQGLSDFWLDHADLKIKIPMNGQADSLNLSVSTGIVLYKIWEQRN